MKVNIDDKQSLILTVSIVMVYTQTVVIQSNGVLNAHMYSEFLIYVGYARPTNIIMCYSYIRTCIGYIYMHIYIHIIM